MIKVKKHPEFFEKKSIEIAWPGDPAIDLASSDLLTWAKSKCVKGLSVIPGEKPSRIVARRLKPQELPAINTEFFKSPAGTVLSVFATCMISVDGKPVPRMGGEILEEDMRAFVRADEWRARLPMVEIWNLLWESLGIDPEKDLRKENPADADEDLPWADEEESDGLTDASIAEVMGVLILADAFRFRRHSS